MTDHTRFNDREKALLSPQELEAIEAGEAMAGELVGGKHLEDYLKLGPAYAALSALAMRLADTKVPAGYHYAKNFKALKARCPHLEVVDTGDTVSNLLWVFDEKAVTPTGQTRMDVLREELPKLEPGHRLRIKTPKAAKNVIERVLAGLPAVPAPPDPAENAAQGHDEKEALIIDAVNTLTGTPTDTLLAALEKFIDNLVGEDLKRVAGALTVAADYKAEKQAERATAAQEHREVTHPVAAPAEIDKKLH